MKAQTLLFLLLLAVAAAAGTAAAQGLLGGYSPITDVSDPEVQAIARFAVAEHNRKSRTKLELIRVVSGETQVVAGTNWRLQILARPKFRRYVASYEVLVYDRPWDNVRKLVSFTARRP